MRDVKALATSISTLIWMPPRLRVWEMMWVSLESWCSVEWEWRDPAWEGDSDWWRSTNWSRRSWMSRSRILERVLSREMGRHLLRPPFLGIAASNAALRGRGKW